MAKLAIHKKKSEAGQAVLLVIAAMSVFLLGAVGLALDGSHLYAQRQAAQAAADAAATAGIVSFLNGTNVGFGGSSAYNCTPTNTTTPCVYAQKNGFGNTTGAGADTVFVEGDPAGVTVTSLDGATPNLLRVTVTRPVSMTLTKLVGLSSYNVRASATAAIVDVLSPIPILILHPTLEGAFSINGTGTNPNKTKICGGPKRSIQVNSNSSNSISGNPGTAAATKGTVDLSKAGPNDPGDCSTGTGADFGDHGGPTGSYPGTLLVGSTGGYREPVGILDDPLSGMSAPPKPANGSSTTIAQGTGDCPSNLSALTTSSNTSCTIYSPGYWDAGINPPSGTYAIFRPGIYYINHNGFGLGSNTIARMATAAGYNSDPNTGTGWTSGMLVYNDPGVDGTTVKPSKDVISIAANSGQINNQSFPDATNCPNGGNCLVGANGGAPTSAECTAGTASASYYGVLFFQSHATATSLSHSISGGAGLSIKGTIYLTHKRLGIVADATYQSLSLGGTSGSTTTVQGEIIVDALSLGGSSDITMNLTSLACYTLRQVALVQ
jgi:hypothetical protein